MMVLLLLLLLLLYFDGLINYELIDKVKKLIFDGGGIPTLIRIFSTNQPEIFPRIAQLLTVMTSNGILHHHHQHHHYYYLLGFVL